VSAISPVLIAGAGLAGLAVAMELSRLGVPVRLIGEPPGPSAVSRTLVVHSLTSVLLEQRGLSPEVLPGSNPVRHTAVYTKGGLLGMAELAPDSDHRRYALLAGQAELERALREQLARQDVVVEYGTELVALAQCELGRPGEPGGPGITARLRQPDGRQEEIAASYLISADGTQGAIGNLLNLSVCGRPERPSYVLAGLRLDGGLRGDVISVFLGHHGFVMLLPAGDGRFQAIATNPPARSGDLGGPSQAELRQFINGCLPESVRLRQMRWSSRFSNTGSLSPPLRRGRVFFGGGSAYAYSPATGQGANSDIQDMINLGWKLGMVLQGKAAPSVLDTYAEERLQVIRQLQYRAEVPADLLGPGSALVHQLLTRIAPTLLDSHSLVDLCAELAGELIPDYWSSPLSAPPRGPGSLQPGGSVPDMRIFAADPGALAGSFPPRAMRLHELVSPSRLNLLLTDDAGAAAAPSAWIEQQLQPWRELLAVRLVTPVPACEERFLRTFGGGQSLILVRPDSHVCFAGRQKALPRLVTWLNTWFPLGADGNRLVRRRPLAGWLHRI
jgi:2-polyprenyl-6-methoxyphenol hydroxylase-like FAD-dependent oxidoreductase